MFYKFHFFNSKNTKKEDITNPSLRLKLWNLHMKLVYSNRSKNHQHLPWSDVEDGIKKCTQYISHFLNASSGIPKKVTYYIKNTYFTSIRLVLAT